MSREAKNLEIFKRDLDHRIRPSRMKSWAYNSMNLECEDNEEDNDEEYEDQSNEPMGENEAEDLVMDEALREDVERMEQEMELAKEDDINEYGLEEESDDEENPQTSRGAALDVEQHLLSCDDDQIEDEDDDTRSCTNETTSRAVGKCEPIRRSGDFPSPIGQNDRSSKLRLYRDTMLKMHSKQKFSNLALFGNVDFL